MAKTVVGLFDNSSDARAALQELRDAGFSGDDISMVANNSRGDYGDVATARDGTKSEAEEGAGFGATGGAVLGGLGGLLVGLGALAIPGIGPVVAAGTLATTLGTTALGAGIGAAAGGLTGALVGAGIPEEDANIYAEGVRRGDTLITVRADDDVEAQRAADIMNNNNVVDIDDRGEEFRTGGWARFDESAGPYDIAQSTTTAASSTPVAGDNTRINAAGYADVDRTTTGSTNIDREGEIAIPRVEEELRVGKRAVERGGLRVRTYVEQVPVNEQVTLRDEEVQVERRPVDRAVTGADIDAFQEGTFEVREHDEEAIVDKQARVVEEVVVRKDVQEHTETIQDTVRRTDVEVEQLGGRGVASTDVDVTGTTGGTASVDTTSTTTDEGALERGASKLGNTVEGATGADIDRDGDVGRRDPRNNI